MALVIESTTANDVCAVSGADKVCCLGSGAVLSFMDKATVYDRELYKTAMHVAEKNDIAVQTKTRIAGGNDAGAIQPAGEGVRVLALSLPTRYIHSAVSTANMQDMQNAAALVKELIAAFGEME